MHNISIYSLLIVLIVLVLVSAFFSGSEIGMMSVNRYRLKHLVKSKNKRAKRVQVLLEKPDRLLGIILIGNTLANIIASAVATVVGQRLYGDSGVAAATAILTFIILIFSEMMPKTLAAIYPEKVAFAVSLLLTLLSRILSPFISFTNFISNGLLKVFGIHIRSQGHEVLSGEELRTVVNESGSFSSAQQKAMFLGLLDLDKVTVDDIMVPRGEVIGLDLTLPWEELLERLETAQHTRLPVFDGELEHVKGVIHIRSILNLLVDEKFSKEHLLELLEKPYFVLEGIGLYQQLIQFQREKRRIAFVVDEYGDIQGLVTLEDILEEIVGEFTTDIASLSREITWVDASTVLIDAGISIRELNKALQWSLPIDGPKTLNGWITEMLAFIPPSNFCIKLNGLPCEILQVKDNVVKTVKVKLHINKGK